ncbi:MAG: hypothetical protein KTR29_13340 [Rhodothermaceae bacterium]|nr:hypothetical protein [Rhodothermaceae bacterium]
MEHRRQTSALSRHVNYTVRVLGDSMLPDYGPGEVYNYIPTDHVFYDGIYVIVIDGCEMIKQVQRMPGGVLRISSLNERYAPFEIEEANPAVQVLGHNLHIGNAPEFLFRAH